MITSIRLINFKNFIDETLRVGPFTILVGANASGKSNIRDAFRFLSGIGRGYTLAEIFGGKREAGWKPIRGAMNEIVRFGQEAFSLEVEMNVESDLKARLMIEVSSDDRNPGTFRLKLGKNGIFGPDHNEHYLRKQVIDILANMRFPEFSPDRMREPAVPARPCWATVARTCPLFYRKSVTTPNARKSWLVGLPSLPQWTWTGLSFRVTPAGGSIS